MYREENIRYQEAIRKNILAISYALWEWQILVSLDNYRYRKNKEITFYGASFFDISFIAIYSDMIRNSINVLEKKERNDVASFWYLLRNVIIIKTLKSYSEEETISLDNLTKKLMDIRDKVFHHYDKKAILNTDKIWRDANISAKELGKGLKYLFCLLSELYQEVFKQGFPLHPEEYREEEFFKLLDLAAENHLIEVSQKIGEESKLDNA